MFALAIFIGLYSYFLFALGVSGLLYKNIIIGFSLLYLILMILYFKNNKLKLNLGIFLRNRLILGLILLQAFVNLIGALGPELGFDALWYHLTLPKIFLDFHKLIHIPGGLFYYSDMPKLTEMLYVLPLSTVGELGAKTIHFIFGLLILIVIYKISRKYINEKFSIISSLIFYSSLVVAWQSTTAYIDLSRTFFEIMALWGFLNWVDTKTKEKKLWLVESAVCLGLAVSSKLLSLETIVVFIILFFYESNKLSPKLFKNIIQYGFISLLIPLPWFIFSFLNTGNPFYPFFTSYTKGVLDLSFNPIMILKTFWGLFTHSPDPVSPLYIIFIPFAFIFLKKFNKQMKIILLFSLISLFLWYFSSARESRYVLPSLAGFSIICSYVIYLFFQNIFLGKLSISVVILTALIAIFYRGIANSKYIPVIQGKETKPNFLAANLNFNYGDFYDTDGYFKKHIKNSDKILLYGFHNLYYIDFPFIDSSYVKKGDKFNYIAVQNGKLPNRFDSWPMIYSNSKTHVKVYYLGGQEWIY